MIMENGEYEDWRGRKADNSKHGGLIAAAFTCGKWFIFLSDCNCSSQTGKKKKK